MDHLCRYVRRLAAGQRHRRRILAFRGHCRRACRRLFLPEPTARGDEPPGDGAAPAPARERAWPSSATNSRCCAGWSCRLPRLPHKPQNPSTPLPVPEHLPNHRSRLRPQTPPPSAHRLRDRQPGGRWVDLDALVASIRPSVSSGTTAAQSEPETANALPDPMAAFLKSTLGIDGEQVRFPAGSGGSGNPTRSPRSASSSSSSVSLRRCAWRSTTGLLPVPVRLIATAVAAISLIAFGIAKARDAHHRVFGLALQGGGFALLYLVGYFMLTRYAMIGQGPAFAAFAALGVGCVALAARQDGPALAVLGLSGAFLAPVLAGGDAQTPLPLFLYFTLLNIFILGVQLVPGVAHPQHRRLRVHAGSRHGLGDRQLPSAALPGDAGLRHPLSRRLLGDAGRHHSLPRARQRRVAGRHAALRHAARRRFPAGATGWRYGLRPGVERPGRRALVLPALGADRAPCQQRLAGHCLRPSRHRRFPRDHRRAARLRCPGDFRLLGRRGCRRALVRHPHAAGAGPGHRPADAARGRRRPVPRLARAASRAAGGQRRSAWRRPSGRRRALFDPPPAPDRPDDTGAARAAAGLGGAVVVRHRLLRDFPLRAVGAAAVVPFAVHRRVGGRGRWTQHALALAAIAGRQPAPDRHGGVVGGRHHRPRRAPFAGFMAFALPLALVLHHVLLAADERRGAPFFQTIRHVGGWWLLLASLVLEASWQAERHAQPPHFWAFVAVVALLAAGIALVAWGAKRGLWPFAIAEGALRSAGRLPGAGRAGLPGAVGQRHAFR